ncbi:mCG1042165, partial [Mus musculus]
AAHVPAPTFLPPGDQPELTTSEQAGTGGTDASSARTAELQACREKPLKPPYHTPFTRTCYVSLIGLELALKTKEASNSQRFICLCVPSAGIKGVHRYAWFCY